MNTQQDQHTPRPVARALTSNHSRVVVRALTSNHSRVVARALTSNHSRAVGWRPGSAGTAR
jgi:hypothetical protein